jgi:hypothetical protein
VFCDVLDFLQRNVDGRSGDNNDAELIRLLLVGLLEEQR